MVTVVYTLQTEPSCAWSSGEMYSRAQCCACVYKQLMKNAYQWLKLVDTTR